ncbi:hypothetical protein [Laspinema sp. D2d]|uniref:hypothetical protein n=1 Tax=Laspinema sp. D2d TaxID=2953686 RepID=UPI0021BB802F|nr:hypothetical protein [Laspinema sp. D2d]
MQQAQLQPLRGEVRFEHREGVGSHRAIALPAERTHLTRRDLSHLFDSARFTAIGNP